MKTLPCFPCRQSTLIWTSAIAAAMVLAIAAKADDKKNPVSKVYVSDVSGEAQIDTGDNIQDLSKRSVYRAQGTVIETKKAETEEDKNKVYSTMVYSNGTGAYFDHDTRVEVKKFVQEPFTPNRADIEVEPSISQTQAYVSRGTVGLCTSKLVAGSNMTYQTPHGQINIRGRKVVIESGDQQTKISMLEGDSTVKSGTQDLGGHTLHAGEQAIIHPGGPGGANQVEIQRIPPSEMTQLSDKVDMACMAKKTVYFEVKEKVGAVATDGENAATAVADAATPDSTGKTKKATTDSDSGGAEAPVTAFDGNSGTNSTGASRGVIVAVPVVPTELPVQFTVSPAAIIKPGG